MIGSLLAQVTSLKDAGSAAGQTQDSLVLGEQFYFFTVVIMWLIHAGFMSYETGIARKKNALATAMKNILTIAVVTPTLLLLRLVDLQLQPARPPDRPELERLHRRRMPGRHPVVRHLRAEPDQQHQPGLLPGVPTVLLDDGLDHVGRDHRARPAHGLSDPRLPPRLGRLDPGRRLGMERRRLAHAPLRLPRLDRVRRRPRGGGRVHARRALPTRAANREIHAGGPGQTVQAAQPPHDPARPDADLHGLLRLLRGVPRDRVHVVPGLGEHLPEPDHARLHRDDHHDGLRRRLHRRLLRLEGRPVLDGLGRPRGRDLACPRARTCTRPRSAT